MKLLEFCLSATFLGFCGSVYQQSFGTAMQSPVSVTVANPRASNARCGGESSGNSRSETKVFEEVCP